MSETVKNKHVKKKNSAVLLLKTVITAVLLFFTWYLCSHFMEYQKNATNQVNKYRIDQVCQLSAGSAVSQKFVAKHTHLKTVKERVQHSAYNKWSRIRQGTSYFPVDNKGNWFPWQVKD